MSPAAGMRSTRANSTHSTCPTTATRTTRVSHPSRPRALDPMMEAVTIPPFERFYQAHSAEILAFLRRRLGRSEAEDAFQETFLRALRAYGRLEHGRDLRAWAYKIAERVAIDVHRRSRTPAGAEEPVAADARPPYAQLEHLAGQLPATE